MKEMEGLIYLDDYGRRCTCPPSAHPGHSHHHSPSVPFINTNVNPIVPPKDEQQRQQEDLQKEPQQFVRRSVSINTALQPPELGFDDHLHEVGFRILQSLQGFLAIVITISIFGASIFASLIQPLEPPPNPQFSIQTIRTFMAMAWLLFVLTLAASVFSVVQLYYEQTTEMQHLTQVQIDGKTAAHSPSRGIPKWKTRTALIVNFITEVFLLGAFMFLSLVVVAYAPPVGWVAVGLDAFCAICIAIIWIQRIVRPRVADPRYHQRHS